MRNVVNAPKRPVNLSLNSKVLDMAKAMDMNISQTVDELLTSEVMRRWYAEWAERNKESVEQYNARIVSEGSLAQRIRQRAAARHPAPEAAG